MQIFKIEQSENNGWDTYDSAVVVAENAEEAAKIYPGGVCVDVTRDWALKEYVNVVLIGTLNESSPYKNGDVICASFNAG